MRINNDKHKLCDRCHKRIATIHLYVNTNGHRHKEDLCAQCFNKLTHHNQNNAGGNNMTNSITDNFGFGSLDNLFNQMANDGAGPTGSFGQSQPPYQPYNSGVNNRRTRHPFLDHYGTNLTKKAKEGKIDPVIGRDKEIDRMVEVLNRREKNNPVLIGKAGVGKTAVVEGLATRIATGKVPAKLQGKEIISVDMVSMVQGTSFRGQFERRMQQLINEVTKNPNIILFIDEIHEIMGAGDAEGALDAGNIIKPALARGTFQLIGATTVKEYRRIEKDSALARRFQPVQINEPTPTQAVRILKGLQPKYEQYHHVHYSDDAIRAAVRLSDRYIQGRYLPDKAIDLMDESGSRKNLTIKTVSPTVLKNEINRANNYKQQALHKEDFEKAAYYRDLIRKYRKHGKVSKEHQATPTVTRRDMEKIVEEITHIPVGRLEDKEETKLRRLAPDLKKHVIGQDKAIDVVTKSIQRSRVGFNNSGRPIGSFLFVGTTGVGKTELAKQLAKEMFGSENRMIRFDMSEYRDPTAVSKLIGSDPGYVGYSQAGLLTEKVRHHPYSVILLDEIEKANPAVINTFLQVLDDGRLTDSHGVTVSFKDTVIIMTSNAGTDVSQNNIGFGSEATGNTQNIKSHLLNYFKPEFLNRFDDIIQFNQLSKKDLGKILNLMLTKMNNMVKPHGFHIHVTPTAKKILIKKGYNPKMGARPLRRVIERDVEDKVVHYYLYHTATKKLTVGVNNKHQLKVSTTK